MQIDDHPGTAHTQPIADLCRSTPYKSDWSLCMKHIIHTDRRNQ